MQAVERITVDFETFSEVELKKTGAWRYAADPSTDILCMAYIIPGKPRKIWKRLPRGPFPADLLAALESGLKIEAHNSFFEYCIWNLVGVRRYNFPTLEITQTMDSAAKAAYHASPRSLGGCGSALRLSKLKDEEGKAVMLKLCKPKKATKLDPTTNYSEAIHADLFKQLYSYCLDDVSSEEAISGVLRDLPENEQKIWALDQKINVRGIHVDIEAATTAIKLASEVAEANDAELTIITGGEATKATQRDKILKWLNDRGLKTKTLQAGDIAEFLKLELDPLVRRVLEIRSEGSKASVAKYQAILNMVDLNDHRIRGLLMYHAASTGRWGGKGFQPHNLPRPSINDPDGLIEMIKLGDLKALEAVYGSPMEALSSAIRSVICAPEGRKLVCADFSAIEARVLLWLAGDPGLNIFRMGEDIYKDMAADIYRKRITEITKEERQTGKVAILGLGYGMGWKKFIETAAGFGINLAAVTSKDIVNVYREKFSAVVRLWYAVENAAVKAILTKRPVAVGRILFAVNGRFLHCKLPSGRLLSFCEPQLKAVTTPWGEPRYEIRFMGTNSMTKKWERQSTYGGKLVENITQAVARDLMAEAMLRAEAEGYEVILTVHDELLCEVPEDFGSAEELESIMSELPTWARGCPVTAEGWEGKRYRK